MGPQPRSASDSPRLSIDQTEVIEFLAGPEAHGGQSVQRIDTHISVVFLAGDRAYKLKRAVKNDYLDYSTLERRRRFCEAEVEINRRTAPDLYLGTVPVTRGRDGLLAISGKGEAVEWLVIMKRFAKGLLLDDLARAGRLTPALMVETADAVAGLHAVARPAQRRDGTDALRSIIEGNEAALFSLTPGVFHAPAVTAWCQAAEAALAAASPTLDHRAREGKVRQCHGDLHLRNIYVQDGSPALFDAIEFSDEIGTIDVLYDVAFLLMDLDHRGEHALANLVLNRYLGVTGDYGGSPTLPLFLSVRAALRAHISAAVAAVQELPSDRDRSGQGASEPERYLTLARRYLAPAPTAVVAIAGLSGSGKSSVARAIAPYLGRMPGAVHVQSDITRKRLFGVQPEVRLGAHAYSEATSKQVYALMREHALDALRAGFSAVVDATFLDPTERTAVEALARETGAHFYGVWLDAPRKVLEDRIAGRVTDPSDATVDVLAAQARVQIGGIGWKSIYSGDTAEATVARVLGQMSRDGVAGLRPPHGALAHSAS